MSQPNHEPTPAPPRPEGSDDAALARKVETEILHAPDAPEGDVSVDVEAGIAHLHGEVADPVSADRIASETRNIDGIRGVDNEIRAE